ncbi:ATP-dependent protease La (LON) domain protein [Forsythia ovata]|uniref:ATP-dependent protease La (LON) domain protein n=1 Tax=Forsythia ovata TaxID=205694 RepID=A0ABD1W8S2_9LAMI
MENERMPESLRLRIEQILKEIDEDEDEESSDCDDQLGSASGRFTYDLSLAASHTYLGEVEETHNRLAFLEGGAVLTLPLFYLEGVVLFPEATLPLRALSHNFKAAVERALGQVDAPCTIGVVRVQRDFQNRRLKFATTGTTAEIKQYRRLEDGSVNVLTRGQQRFRLRRRWTDAEGALCGEVQIIQEDLPLRTPWEAVGKLAPLRNLRTGSILHVRPSTSSQSNPNNYEDGNDSNAMSGGSFERKLSSAERRLPQSALSSCYGSDAIDGSTSNDNEKFGPDLECQSGRRRLHNEMKLMHTENSKRNKDAGPRVGKTAFPDVQPCNRVGQEKYPIGHLRNVPRAFWPSWVYRMYDSYSLAQRAADRWKHVVRAPSMDGFVMKPKLLSFHIASKIPVSESTRQELLEIDGISYRLRREIELLESFDRIRCKICQTLLAKRSDMLVMSAEGPLGVYVNSYGFVYEVLTLRKTKGVDIAGFPKREFSWFPG